MTKSDYYEWSGLEEIYLEDSFVLDIIESADTLCFIVDAVLTEKHVLYETPLPTVQYCYKKAKITFANVQQVKWLEKTMRPTTNVDGSVDFDNIDYFYSKGDVYSLGGSWGELEIISSPVQFQFVHFRAVGWFNSKPA